MKIKYRLLIVLIPSIVLISWALIFVSFKISEFVLLSQISQEATSLARSYSKEMYSMIKAARKVAEGNAAAIGFLDTCSRNFVESLLKKTVEQNNDFFGCAAAFIPEKSQFGRYAPYFYRQTEEVLAASLIDPAYDYQKWDWFTEPIRQGKSMWSEPYFDKGGGNALMVTFSAPVEKGVSRIGVTTVDISLEEFVRRVRSLRVGESGYAFIITAKGYFVAHPNTDLLSSKSVWSMASESGNEDFVKFAECLRAPAPNFFECVEPFSKKQVWMITTPVKSTEWTMAVVYPSAEVFAPLADLRFRVEVLAITTVVVFSFIILWISQSVTAPIVRLVDQAKSYSEGNFGEYLDTGTGPEEMRTLSSSFNTMGHAILQQMENLRRTTSQKERYQQELNIAAGIQQGILPKAFPPFPEFAEVVDLFGSTEPALEVGGDYYDFIRISSDRIAVVAADVAGKGAPSSIFMAMTRMLVLELAERCYHPAEVIRRVNHLMSRNNDSCMFVTLVYGEYYIKTGELKIVSAGHPPPYIIRKSGEVEKVPIKKAPPLGAFVETTYSVTDARLAPGDTLFFYTDGVTEAMDPDGAEYGIDRMKSAIVSFADRDCRELCLSTIRSVRDFCRGAEVSDDLTVLALRRTGQEIGENEKVLLENLSVRLIIPARTAALGCIKPAAEEFLQETGFSRKEIFNIILSFDELATNVIMHAYPPGTEETLQVDFIPVARGASEVITGIQIDIYDHGKEFDFEATAERYTGEDASIDQPVGGVGLFLVKKTMDEVRYIPGTSDGNLVSIVKYKKPAEKNAVENGPVI